VNQDLRNVNAKDFAVLASQDERLWLDLVGIAVDHSTYGRGRVANVELRPNYTPLITLAFSEATKVWPPKSFESGKTHFWLNQTLSVQIDNAAAQLAAKELAAAELARREAEELAMQQQAARQEAKRWASLTPQEQHQERMAALAARQKQRLSRLGIAFKGLRPAAASRFRRVTHCYECHQELDNSVDVECVACNWILCECGACGCGYSKHA
jgi:hypothetical protein